MCCDSLKLSIEFIFISSFKHTSFLNKQAQLESGSDKPCVTALPRGQWLNTSSVGLSCIRFRVSAVVSICSNNIGLFFVFIVFLWFQSNVSNIPCSSFQNVNGKWIHAVSVETTHLLAHLNLCKKIKTLVSFCSPKYYYSKLLYPLQLKLLSIKFSLEYSYFIYLITILTLLHLLLK